MTTVFGIVDVVLEVKLYTERGRIQDYNTKYSKFQTTKYSGFQQMDFHSEHGSEDGSSFLVVSFFPELPFEFYLPIQE